MPCKPAITSMSLGRACSHDLFDKLQAAALAGFKGIEVFYEDLECLAATYDDSGINGERQQHPPATPPSKETLLKAATTIRNWCFSFNLTIIVLQPFMYAEGLISRSAHAQKIDELQFWFQLCAALGTDLILLSSTFLPADQVSGDMALIVSDLLEAVDLAARQRPPIRIAYEALSWGTHVNTWDAAHALVEQVNRPNFGTCIDTFNLPGRIWADPTAPDGKVEDADDILTASLQTLRHMSDPKKIFFVQLISAEKLLPPLTETHPWYQPDQPARMSWSRNARCFAYEDEAYLPVERVCQVLFEDLGFEGWVSMELYSRELTDRDGELPRRIAQRGMRSWGRLVEEFGLERKKEKVRPAGLKRIDSKVGRILDL